MKIAIVSYKKQEQFVQGVASDEDAALIDFLTRKGLQVVPTIWNDANTDWSSFGVAVIKSPWDYHNHLPAFLAWLRQLAEWGVKVLNPVEIIVWNSDKHYLQHIAQKGLPVIPAAYLEKGAIFNEHFFKLFDTDKLVIKPCVSAGAQNTIRVSKNNLHEHIQQVQQFLQEQDYMVQPFVEEINNGEWSFLFFNGQYSHCVLKTPKQNDFRVQHSHGGSISYPAPNPVHVEQAAKYLQHLSQPTLYARVDGVIIHNTFQLMELELIEPYLFLHGDSRLMENYYQALLALAVSTPVILPSVE